MDKDEGLIVTILVFEVGSTASKQKERDSRRNLRFAERKILKLNDRAINLFKGVGDPRKG